MDAPVITSANLGWNLLIGSTPTANGTFVPIAGDTVPVECRTVFGEASKDACFAKAALRYIGRSPVRYLSLVPKKLAYTFEYAGAAGWYLNASNPEAFPERAKLQLGVIETLFERVLLLLSLFAVARAPGPRARIRRIVAAGSGLCLLGPAAWVAHLGLVLGALLLGKALVRHPPALIAALVVGATVVTHAVFFGAGRYGLPVFPCVAALAGSIVIRRFDTGEDGE